MVDRQVLIARAVAETPRRMALHPRLGLSHPRIDGNHRSTTSSAGDSFGSAKSRLAGGLFRTRRLRIGPLALPSVSQGAQ